MKKFEIQFWHQFDEMESPSYLDDEEELPLPPRKNLIDGIYGVKLGRKLPTYETDKPVLRLRIR